jgi:hypothetical protein
MKLKSLILAGALFLPLLGSAQVTVSIAPDAPSKEDVKRLFDLMASKDQMRQIMVQMVAQMRALTRQEIKKDHPEISAADLARADRQADQLVKDFPLEEMLNDMVPVYQKHFSKSDIDGLIAFYSSATGQKFLHEMPAVTAETMQALYPRIQAAVAAAMKQADEKPAAPQK